MNVSFNAYKPVWRTVVPLAITSVAMALSAVSLAQADSGAIAVMATEQPAAPGTGANPGDSARARMQASPQPFAMLFNGVPTATAERTFGAPVMAAEQPAAPGTGANPGDLVRAQMQVRPTSFATLSAVAQHDFRAPVLATGRPAAPGTGANPGDLARAQMQANPQSLAMLAESLARLPKLFATHGTGHVDMADATNLQPSGRAGWNPALVQLQATPGPLPWHG